MHPHINVKYIDITNLSKENKLPKENKPFN